MAKPPESGTAINVQPEPACAGAGPAGPRPTQPDTALNRRSLLSGAARKALWVTPVVMTLAGTSRAQASSPACIPSGGLCADDADCCSAICQLGICRSDKSLGWRTRGDTEAEEVRPLDR